MKKQFFISALKIITVITCCTGSVQTLAAKYYKWVDENGTTHYTAQPPASGEGEVIKVKTGASSDKEAAMKRLEERRAKLQQQTMQQNSPAAEDAETSKRNAEITRKNCEIYQKNLKTMQEHSRIRITDENGEPKVLPEEERQQKINEAEEYIQKNCS
ncbi:MAG: glycosyltransferase [Gammaproteobacteria bacterium]|nr:MAG: glycosyltransferase [Gammaproteobacteria bacterium]